ncbi:MAG: SpoIIE family protein phosphatase [Pirellulales bacterium]|nr:SpoIIE family protein phosphatase [Pirellulales bacterium]
MSGGSLIMTVGPDMGQKYEIDQATMVMGRHPDCEIHINAGAVSRHHAQITAADGKFYIEDLQSRNGTFVNDERIDGRQLLRHADSLRICDVGFRFEDHDFVKKQTAAARDTGFAIDPGSSQSVVIDDDREAPSGSKVMTKIEVSDTARMRLDTNPITKLKAVLEITRSLSKSLSLDEVLPKVVDSLFTIFPQADRGFIVLKEGDDGRLVPKAVKFRRPDDDDEIRISRTIVDEVMRSKEAVLSADAATDSRFQMSQSIADFRIRSMMCAPLLDSEGNPLGVIQIDTLNQTTRFQDDDLEVLGGVAAPAGLAVENAQLHEDKLKQQALQRDLQMARRVQLGFLPSAPPEISGYHFFDYYDSAYEVGGDYHDYIELPDGRLAIIVADVSGKGISAALLTAKLSAEMRFCLATETDPAAAVTKLNVVFNQGGWEDRFVTMLLMVLEPVSGKVTLVNAGHMPPLVRLGDQSVEMPGSEKAGLPIGVTEEFEYEPYPITLSPGDSLAAFTDGFSEAMNAEEELYGVEQLEARFADPLTSISDLGEHILEDVKRHVAGHPQSDDMCLVCVGRD